ncbi:hypothetical protein FPKKO176_contig00032-0004 [Flavobacterium psychrophilum]|nr:hypothetical protein FPKKO176_contig00032-0004 [Flavobacterium psychrophilum]GEJ54424.1 hypothetical protein FPKHI175_contig00051-0003 [Flavobacterium psychrophilum]
MTTYGMKSINDILYIKEMEEEKHKELYVVLVPFLSFIFGIFVIMYFLDMRIDNQIESKGVYVKAEIVDGQTTTSGSIRRKIITNELTINFITKKGESKTYKTEVSKEIFESVSKNLEVDIKYLPESPEVFKLMVGNENIKKFMKISNREIIFNDIEKIINLKQTEILPYLNSISTGWAITEDDKGYIYQNSLKKEMIALSKNGYLLVKLKGCSMPEEFIGKEKILNKAVVTEKNTNGYFTMTKQTFELKDLKVIDILGIGNNGLESNMIVEKKIKNIR